MSGGSFWNLQLNNEKTAKGKRLVYFFYTMVSLKNCCNSKWIHSRIKRVHQILMFSQSQRLLGIRPIEGILDVQFMLSSSADDSIFGIKVFNNFTVPEIHIRFEPLISVSDLIRATYSPKINLKMSFLIRERNAFLPESNFVLKIF